MCEKSNEHIIKNYQNFSVNSKIIIIFNDITLGACLLYTSENYEYNARASEATTRKAEAEARLPKLQSTRAYNESRYGENTSFYGKVNLCVSDMLSVLKGLLSIGH